MSVSELKKQLKQGGCFVDREGTNHEIWYSPITKKHFPVPRHDSKDIPKGTVNRILKDAGLK